ncbi:MAG: efflux RND transporter periplasmic adaptor subunit [Planctomycetaceae bacterium]
MSEKTAGPAPSDENLRRVREKVMQLAREVEQMSGEDMPPNLFFQEFLTRVVAAIGARAGVVWLMDENNRLNVAAQVNLEETGLREKPGALQINERLLIDVLQTGEAKTLISGQGTELPTEHVLVLSALHREKACVGVVELFQRTAVPEKARSGYMQFLEQMCGYASRYIEGKRRNPTESADLKSRFWTDFEQFTLRIQRSLDEQEVADAAASDARPLLGCDRFSVAVRKGRSVRIKAVSGQSSVNPRANLITSMVKLSRRVIESGETLVYKGRIEGLAPQIEKPLANFIQESGSRMVMLVPTFENEVLVRQQGEEHERKRKTKRPRATGCLVIEQVAETEPGPQMEQRAELLADHIGAALWNARTHHRIFGLSLWKLIGRCLEWFHGRKLAITTAVLLAIAGIGAAMGLVRLSYPVDAEGKLMPVEQHAVFALWNGEIREVRVRGGQRVEKGDVLLVMVNDEMEEQILQARGEVQKQIQMAHVTALSIEEAASNDDEQERHQLEIQKKTIEADQRIAEDHLATLLRRREEKLTLRANAGGIIPNFQIEQLLRDRPVSQGDHLFDIMNDNGPWHMELLVEEKRMGHILKAMQELQKSGGTEQLAGEFYLATQPENDDMKCHLTEVATRSTTDPEIGTAFELVAVADEGQELPESRIGAEVTVRLYCGKCSLGYYLFGDVVEFLQRYFWL